MQIFITNYVMREIPAQSKIDNLKRIFADFLSQNIKIFAAQGRVGHFPNIKFEGSISHHQIHFFSHNTRIANNGKFVKQTITETVEVA